MQHSKLIQKLQIAHNNGKFFFKTEQEIKEVEFSTLLEHKSSKREWEKLISVLGHPRVISRANFNAREIKLALQQLGKIAVECQTGEFFERLMPAQSCILSELIAIHHGDPSTENKLREKQKQCKTFHESRFTERKINISDKEEFVNKSIKELQERYFDKKQNLLWKSLSKLEKWKQEGKEEQVRKIVNYSGFLGSPLHFAIWFDCEEVAIKLVELGADINKIPKLYNGLFEEKGKELVFNITPLHNAYLFNMPKLASILIKARADTECKSSTLEDLNPKMCANFSKDKQKVVIDELLKLLDRIKITVQVCRSEKQVQTWFDSLIPMQQRLFQAILKANVEEIELLLPILDVNAQDPATKNTAIHFTCLYKPEYEGKQKGHKITNEFIGKRKQMIKLLLEHNPDLSIPGIMGFTVKKLLQTNKTSKDENVKKLAGELLPMIEEYNKRKTVELLSELPFHELSEAKFSSIAHSSLTLAQ
ncbi:MAG: hypothetical protein HRK26_03595 [Rickettsiaceae bacterium H1]|nr:hypothetical protein [Rickettsiaceae bacterium H1]